MTRQEMRCRNTGSAHEAFICIVVEEKVPNRGRHNGRAERFKRPYLGLGAKGRLHSRELQGYHEKSDNLENDGN